MYKNHLPVVKWLIEQEKNELDERYAHDSSRIFSILRNIILKSKGKIETIVYFLQKTKDLKKKFLIRHRSPKKPRSRRSLNTAYAREMKIRNNPYVKQIIEQLTQPIPRQVKIIQIEEEPDQKPSFGETSNFICPFSGQIMTDPVIASDGHSYERNEFTKWLLSHNNTSPVTKQRLSSATVNPNHTLKKAILSYQAQLEKVKNWQNKISDIQEERLKLSDNYQTANYQQRLLLNEKQHAKDNIEQKIASAKELLKNRQPNIPRQNKNWRQFTKIYRMPFKN